MRLNRGMIRESDQPAQKQTRTTKDRKKQKTQGDRQTLLHAVVYFLSVIYCVEQRKDSLFLYFSLITRCSTPGFVIVMSLLCLSDCCD